MSERIRTFLVPDLGEGLEDVVIVEWLIDEGATLELNQPLCVVETAKAEVEIPAPFAGRLLERGGEAGETLAVGANLARIETTAAAAGASSAAGAAVAEPADGGAPSGAEEVRGRDPVLVGYGVDEAQDRSRRAGGRRAPRPAGSRGPADRPLAKPPVRRLARRLGVDLASLAPGSGPGGIVTRSDVDAAAEQRNGASGLPASPGSRDAEEIVPVRGIRARIATQMAHSRHEIPDATCSVHVDCTALLEVRGRLAERSQRAGRDPVVTPFALLCRTVVAALVENPLLNSSFDPEGPSIQLHRDVNLGIGTATERGLLVTVIRGAHQRSTFELAAELRRLSAEAREGSLPPQDMVGSTFTISNFGALGLDEGVPVINHPEAAILGVGSIKKRPVVVGDDVVARPTASLTLAFDHRVCDGVEAARFLGTVSELVEHPDLMLLDA